MKKLSMGLNAILIICAIGILERYIHFKNQNWDYYQCALEVNEDIGTYKEAIYIKTSFFSDENDSSYWSSIEVLGYYRDFEGSLVYYDNFQIYSKEHESNIELFETHNGDLKKHCEHVGGTFTLENYKSPVVF